ncbi:MAG: membrane protein insertion efficiency factor YidD [Clostridia bacterium]|nr:membrane protein insertion efficiency factor YidD [Clostridia bacterium]
MKWICIALLKAYKATLSKCKNKTCIYTPSCSVYSMEAYEQYGFIRGTMMTVSRLLRCSPWAKTRGIDYVPHNLKGVIKWSL